VSVLSVLLRGALLGSCGPRHVKPLPIRATIRRTSWPRRTSKCSRGGPRRRGPRPRPAPFEVTPPGPIRKEGQAGEIGAQARTGFVARLGPGSATSLRCAPLGQTEPDGGGAPPRLSSERRLGRRHVPDHVVDGVPVPEDLDAQGSLGLRGARERGRGQPEGPVRSRPTCGQREDQCDYDDRLARPGHGRVLPGRRERVQLPWERASSQSSRSLSRRSSARI
jgi:hypothetical protein